MSRRCLSRFDRWASVGLAALSVGLVAPEIAFALPVGPSVAGSLGGSATFSFTPNTLTVSQTASRVVIDWTSFNIAKGETVQFNQAASTAIAFNRVNSNNLTTIAGSLNANGSVWLFSPGGILFSASAVVNTGSFVASTGYLSDVDQALNSNTVSLSVVTQSGTGAITVQPGATITANAGFVALQSETINQGGAISASDAVNYQVSEGGTLTFYQNGASLGLQPVLTQSYIPGSGQPTMTHTGSTTAGSFVEIDVPGGAVQPGFASVINLGGTIQAMGVAPGLTEGVTILAGNASGPALSGYNGSTTKLDTTAAAITASGGGVYIAGDTVKLGSITTAGDLKVNTYNDITVAGPESAGGALSFATSGPGGVTIDANIKAATDVSILGDHAAIGPGVTVQADDAGSTAGQLIVATQGDLTMDSTALLLAGASTSSPSGAVVVSTGDYNGSNYGGEAVLGGVSGSAVTISSGVVSGVGGDLTLDASVHATGAVTLIADNVLTINSGAAVQSDMTAPAAPTWPVVASTDPGVSITAASLNLLGTITSGPASGRGDVLIRDTSGGTALVGGAANPNQGGFQLSNAALQQITARDVIVAAGSGDNNSGAVANLTVGDVTIDPSRISALWLGVSSDGTLLVSGSTAPVTANTGNIRLGFTENTGGSNLAGFIPGEIDVQGALGTSATPLQSVDLISKGDIILGSAPFIAAAQASTSFDASAASTTYPPTSAGYLFVATQSLELAAQGRILQQNTGTSSSPSGILTDAPTTTTPLLVAPSSLQGATIGSNSWTPTYGSGPTQAVLFGAFSSGNGVETGTSAALNADVGLTIANKSTYVIDGCSFGCSSAQTVFQAPVVVQTGNGGVSNSADSGGANSQAASESSDSQTSTDTQTASNSGSSSDDSTGNGSSGARAATTAATSKSTNYGGFVFPIKRTDGAGRGDSSAPVTGSGNPDLWGGSPDSAPGAKP